MSMRASVSTLLETKVRRVAVLTSMSLLVAPMFIGTAAAQSNCPDVSENGLSIALPSNSCHYKLMDVDNGYAELCNTWSNNACGTLIDGNKYKIDKWNTVWAADGTQTFTASGSNGPGDNPVEPSEPVGTGPIDSLVTHEECVTPVVPGDRRYYFSECSCPLLLHW